MLKFTIEQDDEDILVVKVSQLSNSNNYYWETGDYSKDGTIYNHIGSPIELIQRIMVSLE